MLSASARGLSTGPLIVLAVSVIVLISLLLAPERGILWEQLRRRRERDALRGVQVLETLHAMAADHGDPRYPAELGSLDAFHGVGTRKAIARLEARGLVEPVRHAPETTPHWELTPSGIKEAARQARERGDD